MWHTVKFRSIILFVLLVRIKNREDFFRVFLFVTVTYEDFRISMIILGCYL